ncbi:MAG: choice-of-anchor L domain-containing protein [Chitinophagales bacterium]
MLQKNSIQFLLLSLLILFYSNPLSAIDNCYEVCDSNGVNSTIVCIESVQTNILTSNHPIASKVSEYQSGKLYVKVKENIRISLEYNGGEVSSREHRLATLIEECSIYRIEKAFKRLPEMQQYYRIYFRQNQEPTVLIEALQKLSFVEFAEQVPLYQKFLTPNDLHPDQWNLKKVEAEGAWDLATGNKDVWVAMVDDAVLTTHEDLAANIWRNDNEIANNGIDDDGNGYVDDVMGWDAGDNDNDPNPPNTGDDSFSHGTHCAGIVSAATDNGLAIAAMGYNVTIIPVKTADDATASLVGAMEGVEYAIAAGAHVISMSWGGGAPSQTDQDVFNLAHNKRITLVAAAGNSDTDSPMYPASYDHIISVGASDSNDRKASFSNFGPTIDVMAPGVQIYSSIAVTESSYDSWDGTSMACPLVSGLAALMLSLDPELHPDTIEACLKRTADNIDNQNPDYIGQLGAGRINARNAMICVPSEPIANFTTDFIETACAGQAITFHNISGGLEPKTYEWQFPGGNPATSMDKNPIVTYPSNGTYQVTLKVSNDLGSDDVTKSIVIAQPTAKMVSNDTTIFAGFPAYLEVAFTGTPPWRFTYTENGTIAGTVSDIYANPYVLEVYPDQETTYGLAMMRDAACNGNVSGNMKVGLEDDTDCYSCPYFLVEEVLTGGGCLIVENVIYRGDARALGYFKRKNNMDIGFTEGIMLLTGDSTNIYGPNNDDGINKGEDLGEGGDSDLANLLPGASTNDINDAAVLEFDFVPTSETLTFNYVFASEEYPEYVCSNFNDVFAFFISGPDIAGQKNIALIPNSNIPVAINSVNRGQAGQNYFPQNCTSLANSQYYVNNPFNSPRSQMDGYTVPLTATATNLIPCQTYHIKLAIADVGDGIFDSAVFLEANSFSAGSEIDVASIGSVNGTRNVLEGCQTGQFVFKRVNFTTLDEPYPIEYTVGGTAISGVDYTGLNGQIIIPPGDTSVTVTIEAINDNLEEPVESITLTIENVQCDCTFVPLSASLLLFDNTNVDAGENQVICEGESVQLSASGGKNHLWSPAEGLSSVNTASPVASPTSSTWYTVIAEDDLGCTVVDSVRVFVEALPYLPDTMVNVVLCFDEVREIQLTDYNKISDYTYTWSPAMGLNNPKIPNPVATISESVTYTLTVRNQQGCETEQIFEFLVDNVGNQIELQDIRLCPDKTTLLDAGEGFSSYEWSNGETTQIIEVSEAGVYSVLAMDTTGCQSSGMAEVLFEEAAEPSIVGELQFVGGGGSTSIGTGFFDDYLWSNGQTTANVLVTEAGVYAVTVTNSVGCTGIAEVMVEEVLVDGYLIPNAFSPNRDGVNDTWGVFGPNIVSLDLYVFNRWGKEIFHAQSTGSDWDGTYNFEDQPIGTYVYYGQLTLLNGEIKTFQGNVTLIR